MNFLSALALLCRGFGGAGADTGGPGCWIPGSSGGCGVWSKRIGITTVGKWFPVLVALSLPIFLCCVGGVERDPNHSAILWSSRTQTARFGRAARPSTPDCTPAMCSLLELSSTAAKPSSAGCETPAPPGWERSPLGSSAHLS